MRLISRSNEPRYRQLGRTTALASQVHDISEELGEDVYLVTLNEFTAKDASNKFGINATCDLKWLIKSQVKFIIDTSVFEMALQRQDD